VLYRTVDAHLEAWLALSSAGQFNGQGEHHTPAAYVEQAFRNYLECGIFAHGFARVRCDDCAHDYLVAFARKGRRVPLVQRAAHDPDGGAPGGPCFSAPAGVPVGVVGAKAAALLHAA